ncbi:effector binding domain-containing protein [Paenibacillus sacheonensis]|uniref:AraC effector-binding domain-containing protein n=1 Tax=Paenibacillus sacheonensis TaxID=742054 RepID=A0A7X4YNR4_9BACL|nr:effector binding domain-containing protein [Paenibacillus sacheonensis]MBM7565911.1 putative transcriptional regulator YdeE [Paenibacillus sacheonensis]NBC68774.1 hypothetical protein [Paenibacillus sacheonensis]
MRVRIVEMPEVKAAVIRSELGGEFTRAAWRRIRELLGGHGAVKNEDYGFVFIPEWQWANGVRELWTGVEVSGFEGLPDGLETITIPARTYAKLTVRGDMQVLDEAYGFLSQWFEREGIERDVTEGSLGFEANRLNPVNPFDIPRPELTFVDYDIYAPIKSGQAIETDRFPNIESVEVKAIPQRRVAGVERFVRQAEGEDPAVAIPAIWAEFHRLNDGWKDIRACGESFGLFTYAPPFGPGQDFLYLACVELAPGDDTPVPEGMTERVIPAHEFAVITHRGPLSHIHQAWGFFHGSWRLWHSNGYAAVDEFEYERYDERYLGPEQSESVIELHFPIAPASQPVPLTDKRIFDEKGGFELQDLRNAQVHMACLKGAELHGVDLRNASLEHVNFVHSTWQHIYFSNVHVKHIQLGGTVFEGIARPKAEVSSLEGEAGTDGWVNVEPVVFRDSDLSQAVFDNCRLNGVQLRGCEVEGMTIDGIPVAELLAGYAAAKSGS